MKKSLVLAGFLAILLMTTLNVSSGHAYSPKVYPTEAKVRLSNQSSITITPNTVYQLVNQQTGQFFYSVPNQSISVRGSNSETQLHIGGTILRSTNGWQVKELLGEANETIVLFSRATEARRGASTNYAINRTYQAFQGAKLIGSHNAAGVLWYNIEDEVGVRHWVNASTSSLHTLASLPIMTHSNGSKYRGSFIATTASSVVTFTNSLDIEDYLKGVVPSEMVSSWHMEALKAQAVSARSFAILKGVLANNTTSQVYKGYSAETTRTSQAVDETKGLIVKSGSKIVETFFFSTSGGRTANIQDVWNTVSQPYYVSVDDTIEQNAKSPYSNWSVPYSAAKIVQNAGFNPSKELLLDIQAVPTGANGEIGKIFVTTTAGSYSLGERSRANELTIRQFFKLDNGWNLYSNWFTLTPKKVSATYQVQTATGVSTLNGLSTTTVKTAASDVKLSGLQTSVQTATEQQLIPTQSYISEVQLTGKGFGHRIGMSQYGAKARADAGWKYDAIIKHYFPGTTITKY